LVLPRYEVPTGVGPGEDHDLALGVNQHGEAAYIDAEVWGNWKDFSRRPLSGCAGWQGQQGDEGDEREDGEAGRNESARGTAPFPFWMTAS
jgi:hypothetical protein